MMECEDNIGSLANKLFHNLPSFIETSQFENGCPPMVKKFVIHAIVRSDLANSQKNIIEKCVNICHDTICLQSNCNGKEKTSLSIGE